MNELNKLTSDKQRKK